MRLIAVLIISAALVSTSPSSVATPMQSTDSGRLRVMTFNIRYDEPRDKENAWPNRKELVAGLILSHQTDIVGVQEALKGQLVDLGKLLPDYAWVGVGRADGKDGGEFSAIFYRKDLFKSLETSTFWLSETPHMPSTGWDAALPRIVTWAKLQDLRTRKSFFVFNTHFDHRGERARTESSRLLLDRISRIAKNLPVIVTGDFNFTESAEGYRILTGKNSGKPALILRDTLYVSERERRGPSSTFNDFKAFVPGRKIDYVFVKGNIRVLQHEVLDDTPDGKFPSDHFPVLAEMIIR